MYIAGPGGVCVSRLSLRSKSVGSGLLRAPPAAFRDFRDAVKAGQPRGFRQFRHPQKVHHGSLPCTTTNTCRRGAQNCCGVGQSLPVPVAMDPPPPAEFREFREAVKGLGPRRWGSGDAAAAGSPWRWWSRSSPFTTWNQLPVRFVSTQCPTWMQRSTDLSAHLHTP